MLTVWLLANTQPTDTYMFTNSEGVNESHAFSVFVFCVESIELEICVVRKVFCFAWMFMLCSGSESSEIILFIHIYYSILASCKQLNKLTDIFLDKFGKHKIYDLSYFMFLWMYFEWAKQKLLLEVHYSYIRTKWF
jgi:hypothetical protein